MAEQNTFKILLLNDANMIGEHKETKMKMPNMCPMCIRIPCRESKVPNQKLPIWHF